MRNVLNDLESKKFNMALYCFLHDITYHVAVNLENPFAGGKAASFKIQSFTVLTLKASKSVK
jgi:hypothetical protein